MLGDLALAATVGVTYLGAFGRLTRGRYTPAFYAYQLDRAPDDASTRFVPYVDATLGTLLLFATTRPAAAFLCACFQGIGIVLRVRDGKSAAPDLALFSAAVVAFLGSIGLVRL
ncbi:hypothetical protein SPI_05972 [Niveomyces insectorum RCEF 264]|uniref:Uncharacterized protein n=1 Tax=Niveomyces insectorum RCEF 264 TaxID=1081102 RepID=A0A167SN50_9HYPO|nr:hypothetical protein SPI_05972 [Niveomyces insectorum RCEF 264]